MKDLKKSKFSSINHRIENLRKNKSNAAFCESALIDLKMIF